MQMRSVYKVVALSATIPLLFFSNADAANTCRCPVLERDNLMELYGTGETYDDFRGYIPHTRRKVTREARETIERADFTEAFISQDGTCTCWYSVRDSNNRELDELGLEELEPELTRKKTG